MSVVIKGMTMPYSCHECWIRNVETEHCQGADVHYDFCGICHRYIPYEISMKLHRPDWCPLEEVDDD